MSNSSFLDNPLLKVSRPVAACSRCRTAKIKCDGKLPACSACEKAGKAGTCSGASDEFARGKERSYVASLEGYCERLEKRISNLRRRQLAGLTDGSGVIQENSITSVSSPGSLAQSHRREVTDIDDLVGDFGFLSVCCLVYFHLVQTNVLLGLSMPPLGISMGSLLVLPSPIFSCPYPLLNHSRPALQSPCHCGMKQHRFYSITLTISSPSYRSSPRQISGRRWMLFTSLMAALLSHLTIGPYVWYLQSLLLLSHINMGIRAIEELCR